MRKIIVQILVSTFFLATAAGAGDLPLIRTAFVIVFENQNWSAIKGSASAPYINNTLLPQAAHCENYFGIGHPSEPNYIWMEAGSTLGISNDNDPSSNHQSTTNHLVTLLNAANVPWKSWQEDISGSVVPLTAVNKYAPKHNPMVYFDDVTGINNANYAYGIAHIRPYTEFAGFLATNTAGGYNFITPNLCNDGHDSCAPLNNGIRQSDTWLSNAVAKIVSSAAYTNKGAIFILWDECAAGQTVPSGMIVLSPLIKSPGYTSALTYNHSSLLRTIQEIFNVTPLIRDAANATNLSDLFKLAPSPPANVRTVPP